MKLNKKGYMLVEIILASALAFGLAFFIIDLVIRLKNKNDDLLVETLITTDKTIITNKLMSYAQSETKDFDCNKLTITGNTVKYDDEVIDIITDYANVGELSCSTKAGKVSITIPISVPQMPNKDYDITFDYKYEIGDITPPTCTITVSGTTITATFEDNDGGSGIDGNVNDTKDITKEGTYRFTTKDKANNERTCSVEVELPTSYNCKRDFDNVCPGGYSKSGNSCTKKEQSCSRIEYHWICVRAGVSGTTEIITTVDSRPHEMCSKTHQECVGGLITYTAELIKCKSDTEGTDGCYKNEQNTCSSPYNITNANCSEGYTATSNNAYCYKINETE